LTTLSSCPDFDEKYILKGPGPTSTLSPSAGAVVVEICRFLAVAAAAPFHKNKTIMNKYTLKRFNNN